MTAITPTTELTAPGSPALLPGGEADLFTKLLGSVGRTAAPIAAGHAVEIGRQGAPAAPKPGKKGGETTATLDPTALAVAELGSKGATKATVAEAEKDLSRARERPAQRGEKTAQSSASTRLEANEPQAPSIKQPSLSRAVEPAVTQVRPGMGSSAVPNATSKAPEGKSSRTPVPLPSISGLGATFARPLASRQVLGLDRAQPAPQRSNLRPIAAPSQAAKTDADAKTQHSKLPAPRDAETEFVEQLGRGFSAILRQNGGTLTLRLQPEALGDLTIKMDLKPGKVAATFEVQSDQAQELLTTHLSALRSALEARGLGVDSLTVHVNDKPVQDVQAPAQAEFWADQGGAGDTGGGAAGGFAGTDDPRPQTTRSVKEEVPEAGAPGEESGGAHIVRLVLDAIA